MNRGLELQSVRQQLKDVFGQEPIYGHCVKSSLGTINWSVVKNCLMLHIQ